MAHIAIYSNEKCLPTGEVVPFTARECFESAVVQCEAYTGYAPTHISEKVAIVPFQGDRRFVITKESLQ